MTRYQAILLLTIMVGMGLVVGAAMKYEPVLKPIPDLPAHLQDAPAIEIRAVPESAPPVPAVPQDDLISRGRRPADDDSL